MDVARDMYIFEISYISIDNNIEKYTIIFCQNNSIIVVYLNEYVEFRSE